MDAPLIQYGPPFPLSRRPGAASNESRTILFTDAVAATPLLAQLKDLRMREVMRDHDAVLRLLYQRAGVPRPAC